MTILFLSSGILRQVCVISWGSDGRFTVPRPSPRPHHSREGAKPGIHLEPMLDGIQHCACFDKLSMREARSGRKNSPQPELVEGRTALIPAFLRGILRCVH